MGSYSGRVDDTRTGEIDTPRYNKVISRVRNKLKYQNKESKLSVGSEES